jgi:glycosyltransferase involved in cell wall biosynthesis
MPRSWFFDLSAFNWKRRKRLFTAIEDMIIVTPSEWLKGLTDESFLSAYRSIVINNGINLETFKPITGETYNKLKGLNKKIVIGVASTWSTRKGLNDFIELSKRLPDSHQIVLVGISKEELNCEHIIAYKRTTNQKELAEIYTAADVFANPTTEDNFPTVNLEALACGTPIVTYRTGGSPESVDDKTGIIVEQGNLGQMLDAILCVTNNGKEYYSNACIEKSKKYDMNARFNDYVNLYEEILQQ